MERVLVMGCVHILATVLVAIMPYSLSAWKVEKKTELRVYQGIDDIPPKYPFMVILQPHRFCTGSLVTPLWVLTAAHCCVSVLQYIQYGNLSIPLQLTDSKSRVMRKVPHPQYRYSKIKPIDIALLLLRPRVRMDKYGTISAVDYTTLLGVSVEYVGGGKTFLPVPNDEQITILEKLDFLRPMQIGQGVISSCRPIYKGYICVSPKCSFKQIIMPGDSGGPLFVDNKLVGIVKGGAGLDFNEKYDRFCTPISPHIDWIHRVITSRPKKNNPLLFQNSSQQST